MSLARELDSGGSHACMEALRAPGTSLTPMIFSRATVFKLTLIVFHDIFLGLMFASRGFLQAQGFHEGPRKAAASALGPTIRPTPYLISV